MTNAPAPSPLSSGKPSRRPRLLGVAIGLLVPMLPFLAFNAGMPAAYWWLGSGVWSVVAFVGVALLFFERTRRLGVGMLLGFGGLLVVVASAFAVVSTIG